VDAATEIGQMINRIFKLAREAGLVVEIKIKPAPSLALVKTPAKET
jgi:hypothetical protein